MGIIEKLLKKVVLQEATIEEKTKLSSAAYKIRLKSESIAKADFTPGYFLRLGIGIDNEDIPINDKVRSYSVWDINKSKGFLDIAIAAHSSGIGAAWAAQSKPGDTVYFKWKKGNFLVDDSADSYLMIGDLSALSHLYMINRSFSKQQQVAGIAYSQDRSELFPDVDGATPFTFYEMPPNPVPEIVEEVKKLVPKMKGRKIVYLAGDSRVCVALNQYFRKELQWDAKQVKTKPFWNPTKKGLE
ncbi:MAG: SIP domain-containing protein [Imperialibacter sp.]|uniref:siderophore-interacting protein n=1 Tax=Imperialibacter sp. TaxID=2038411 RepID=UPI0032EE7551